MTYIGYDGYFDLARWSRWGANHALPRGIGSRKQPNKPRAKNYLAAPNAKTTECSTAPLYTTFGSPPRRCQAKVRQRTQFLYCALMRQGETQPRGGCVVKKLFRHQLEKRTSEEGFYQAIQDWARAMIAMQR